jgi:hypothetical protein
MTHAEVVQENLADVLVAFTNETIQDRKLYLQERAIEYISILDFLHNGHKSS